MDLKKVVQKQILGADREDSMPKTYSGIVFYCVRYHYLSLLWLNVLFLLSCIPVITIPGCCTAMAAVTARFVQDKPFSPWKVYWQELKQDFGKRLILWLLMCALPLSAGFYSQLLGLEKDGTGARFLAVVVLFLVQQYWYVCMALIRVSPWENLKNAILLAAVAWKKSLSVLLTSGLLYAVCLLFPLYGFPFLVLCLFSLTYLFSGAILVPEVLHFLGKTVEKERKE